MPRLVRRTKRLVVRPLRLSDYRAWHAAHTGMLPQQNRWDRAPKTEEEASPAKFRALLKSQAALREADKFFDLAVFERSSRKMVGTVAIMDVLRGLGHTAYLGYFIYNHYWGRGFGKEAARAAIDIAFRDVRLHRIEAGIEPRNRRSIFLARSLGLRKEGLKKRAVYLRGGWNDLVMYSATCEEFGVKWKGIPQPRLR